MTNLVLFFGRTIAGHWCFHHVIMCHDASVFFRSLVDKLILLRIIVTLQGCTGNGVQY